MNKNFSHLFPSIKAVRTGLAYLPRKEMMAFILLSWQMKTFGTLPATMESTYTQRPYKHLSKPRVRLIHPPKTQPEEECPSSYSFILSFYMF